MLRTALRLFRRADDAVYDLLGYPLSGMILAGLLVWGMAALGWSV